MIFAIYGSRHQDAYLEYIERFFRTLAARGDEAVVHSKLYSYLLHLMPAALGAVRRVTDDCGFTADYAVSIGGDGSLLRTAAWVADKEIPIIGVNTGHLGYLTTWPVEQLEELPARLAAGAPQVEPRSLIAVDCAAVTGWPYALNEVEISRGSCASIVEVDAALDGDHLACYRADGLLVATPTGSTAYNLSVGGPILQPTAPVFVLSPVSAHSLSMRPLVVADSSVIDVRVNVRARCFRLALDGHSYQVPADTAIRMRRAPFRTLIAQMGDGTFATTLHNKLSWG